MNPPLQESTIDFTTYTDRQLLSALESINRATYESNYQACKNEIEKRKADGTWCVNGGEEVQDQQSKVLQIEKLIKIFALSQAIGGVFGAIAAILSIGASLISSTFSPVSLMVSSVSLPLFVATTVAASAYWNGSKEKLALWKTLLKLQVPSFSIFGFKYDFYAGIRLLVGIDDGWFSWIFNVGATTAHSMSFHADAPFYFTMNLVALLVLYQLHRLEKYEKSPSEENIV